MTEAYLQYVWAQKRLSFPDLKLIDGNHVVVREVGEHNVQHSGPDFKNGCIHIDGISLYGAIEIHVKASDWYKHKHHLDPAYNNVVLHVVYEYDRKVIIDDYEVPTLELKNYIDKRHYWDFLKKNFNHEEIVCSEYIGDLCDDELRRMKRKALLRKWQEKQHELDQIKQGQTKEEMAANLLGIACGMGVNKEGFYRLMKEVDYTELKRIGLIGMKHLLWSKSGLINIDGSNTGWHRKGTRPGNFPYKRLNALVYILDRTKLDWVFNAPLEEWSSRMRSELERVKVDGKRLLTNKFIDHLIVNAVVPLVYLTGAEKGEEIAAQELKKQKRERNRLVKKWENTGIAIRDAYDSQSLLALDRYYCCRKKCLSCDVARKILNRSI